jgi:hypothetical protein
MSILTLGEIDIYRHGGLGTKLAFPAFIGGREIAAFGFPDPSDCIIPD